MAYHTSVIQQQETKKNHFNKHLNNYPAVTRDFDPALALS